ncbi:MAG: hypothetical protein IK081_03400 [Lachnospiraceae bacterium]|nr:hypothetical protein [Lachnospiraceae bacterium]
MLKMTAAQKRMIAMFLIIIFLAVLYTSAKLPKLPIHDVHTFLYAGLVIAWGLMVHQRIVNPKVRRYLVAASVFMLILFLSRLVRWRCLYYNAFAKEYAWYAYYVSFVGVPICAIMAALCVGKEEGDRPLRHAKWLWLILVVFTVIVFTNGWHELFFRFQDETHENYAYGPAYYACVVLVTLLAAVAMIIIIRRCQVTAVRKYWVIPAGGMLFFGCLIVWYYVCGGAPDVFGLKLFQLQETFCMFYVFPFESMIQLGIMPSNTRYELFFENSPVSASIRDEEGIVVYASRKMISEDDEHETSAEKPWQRNDTLRRNEKEIHGGKIVWYEDLTAIRTLDQEIRNVTEELEEENELIRQENEIRSERIRYETQNHLYDKIAKAVKEKALAIDTILTELVNENANNPATERADGLTEDVRRRLMQAMVLGAYVKRMGNMMLITEESERISTKELGSAIRESLEYFGLMEIPHDFQEKGEALLPEKVILLSYELLEAILENVGEIYSLLVFLDAREEFLLRIMTDVEELPVDEGWRSEELARAGITLKIESVDETWRIDLRFPAGEAMESACKGVGKEGGA